MKGKILFLIGLCLIELSLGLFTEVCDSGVEITGSTTILSSTQTLTYFWRPRQPSIKFIEIPIGFSSIEEYTIFKVDLNLTERNVYEYSVGSIVKPRQVSRIFGAPQGMQWRRFEFDPPFITFGINPYLQRIDIQISSPQSSSFIVEIGIGDDGNFETYVPQQSYDLAYRSSCEELCQPDQVFSPGILTFSSTPPPSPTPVYLAQSFTPTKSSLRAVKIPIEYYSQEWTRIEIFDSLNFTQSFGQSEYLVTSIPTYTPTPSFLEDRTFIFEDPIQFPDLNQKFIRIERGNPFSIFMYLLNNSVTAYPGGNLYQGNNPIGNLVFSTFPVCEASLVRFPVNICPPHLIRCLSSVNKIVCVSSIEDCVKTCPNVQCSSDPRNPICVDSIAECRAGVLPCLPEGSNICWDGSIDLSVKRRPCRPLPSCPANLPVRCSDGRCVTSPNSCGTQLCSAFPCPDGTCASWNGDCNPYNNCPVGTYQCPDGKCTLSINECHQECRHGFYHCFNGQCVENVTLCEKPAWQVKPIEIEFTVDINNDTTLTVPDENLNDNEMIKIKIPSKAISLQDCLDTNTHTTFRIDQVGDSELRKYRHASWSDPGKNLPNLLSNSIELTIPSCALNQEFEIPIELTFKVSKSNHPHQENKSFKSKLCPAFEDKEEWICIDDFRIEENENYYLVTLRTNHLTKFSIVLKEDDKSSPSLSALAIGFITLGLVAAIAILLVILVLLIKRNRKNKEMKEIQLENLSSQTSDMYIDSNEVEIRNKSDFGPACEVYHGTWKSNLIFGVKAPHNNLSKLRSEARRLMRLRHPNVARVYGISESQGSVYLITEKTPQTLRELLKKEASLLTINDLFEIATSIAAGLEYLEKNKALPQHLTSMNILISKEDNYKAKISGFGFNEFSSTTDSKSETRAIRWSAPEKSKKSLSYSFGLILWELWTGQEPYPNQSEDQIKADQQAGILLPQPQECSSAVYLLMKRCWNFNPNERPGLSQIYADLENIQNKEAPLDSNFESKENVQPKKQVVDDSYSVTPSNMYNPKSRYTNQLE